MRRELFKLGACIGRFTVVENRLGISFEVFIEERQRVRLNYTEIVDAFLMIQARGK